ncbi:MAG: glycosyltransferase family 10 [Nanoarchaeota archaeon]
MYKPTILPYWHTNPYQEQTRQVGIYNDTLNIDSSDVKILIQREPPQVLNIVDAIIKNQDRYDLILAWNEDVLNNCKNSKKFLFGDCWLKKDLSLSDKQNYISFLTSDKNFTTGHQFRQNVYNLLKVNKRIGEHKIIAIKTPPRIPDKDVIFENCKFSVTIENVKIRNFFTEKIIDCFMSKTVPIYCGCPNISEYFNPEGIIFFDTEEELMNILHNLTEDDYNKKLNYVEENFVLAKQYCNFFERVDKEVENFLKK